MITLVLEVQFYLFQIRFHVCQFLIFRALLGCFEGMIRFKNIFVIFPLKENTQPRSYIEEPQQAVFSKLSPNPSSIRGWGGYIFI